MSNIDSLAEKLAKTLMNTQSKKPTSYDTQAEVRRIEGDTAWVHIPGGVDETPVQLTTSAKKGDIVQVRISGGRAWLYGNQTNPPTDDTKADEVDKKTAVSVEYVDELNSRNVTAESINAATDYIDDLYSKNITTDNLKATTGYIQDLTSENITTDNLKAATGYIQDLTSENITANDITADHATVGSLDANYAQIDMANVNNAWIENGAIKKAEVFDENVFDLSGNRATLSRIDASKINVANLRADNLVVRRINGQPVVGGYTLISNTSPGYDTKNPQALGWYEFSNGQWVLSTDTTVNETKAYYQEGDEVSLYDQSYINGMKDNLQQQIDGAVETFTGTVVPTLANYPYTDWYDTSVTPVHDERAKHVGDIYYVVNSASDKNGYCYRFTYDNTSHAYSWVLIKDSDVTKALSDISDLQTFESETTSWIDETDQGLETIRTNHTTLVGVVNKTVKESIQLWFTKANTTAPSKPTAEITSTSTAGNAWRKVVPAWDASYPNYYYCWQYKFVDGTFGWSDVIRDIAMGETQGMSRDAKNTADAALPASTFESFESTTFTDLVDEVDEQSTTMTNMTTRLGMNADGTGASTDIVSKESALEQTVGGISSRVSKTETKLAGMYATSSTAAGTAAKVATITPAIPSGSTWELGTGTTVTVKFTNNNTTSAPTLNINSTGAKAIKSYSGGNLSEAEYKWTAGSTFTFTYNGTNWLMQDSTVATRISSAETEIQQTADNVLIKATKSGASSAEKAAGGQSVIQSLINVAPEGVYISAEKVDIAGAAVFSSYSTTTEMNAAIGNAVNNIEIGGKNILSHSGDYADWIKSASGITTSGNVLSIDVTGKTSNVFTRPYGFLTEENLTEGTIVVSFEVYSDDWSSIQSDRGDWKRSAIVQLAYRSTKDSSQTLRYAHMTLGNYGTNDYFLDVPSTMTDGKWIKFVTRPLALPTDFANDASKGTGQYISVEPCLVRNGHIKFRNIKVEKGTKATDWTPAPEDVTEAINAAQTTANAANNKVVTFRGTCSTGWTDGNKVVSCTGFPTTIPTGAKIDVYCYSSNNASTLTLNVNNSGAKTVKVDGVATGSTNQLLWFKGVTISFTYDGSSWLAERPTSFVGGTCSTAADTADKVTLIEMPVVQKGTQITVPMTNFNTAGTPKLKLQNSAGTTVANALYFGSGTTVPTKANGFSWPAGANVIFTFDGQYWKFGNQTFIDGGNILTGTISADRIGANSLKIGKIDTTDADTASAILNSSIKLGGRNFVPHSDNLKDFSIESSSYVTRVIGDGYTDITRTTASGTSGYGIYYDIEVEASTDYTISATFSGISDEMIWAIGYKEGSETGKNQWSGVASAQLITTSGRNERTFNTGTATKVRLYVGLRNKNGVEWTTRVSYIQLEKGNKATDWSPSPDDAIDYIDSIEIGGRNLLRQTIKSHTATSYNAYQLYLTEPLVADTEYTLQLWGVSLDSNSTGIGVFWGGGSNPLGNTTYVTGGDPLIPDANGYACRTFTVTSANTSHANAANLWINFYNYLNGHSNSSMTMTKWKLEKGNKATDWSPADDNEAEYIVGTHGSTATNVWTGVSKDTAIYVGKTIQFYMTSAGTSSEATLNLMLSDGTTTGAKNVRWNNSNITTHYPQYSVLTLTYDGTYWRTSAYNSDTYDRHRINNSVKVAENIPQYCVAGWSGTGYKRLVSGLQIDLSHPICYLNQANVSGQTYAVASGGTTTNFYDAIPSVNLTNTKSGWSGTAYKTVYVKGTLNGNMFTVHSDVFTTTAPSSDDGYTYIPIGVSYGTTTINFSYLNEAYVYKNGKIQQASATTATDYIFDAGSNGIWVTPSDKPPASDGTSTSTTTGWHIADALELVRNGITYIKAWLDDNVPKIRIGTSDGVHTDIGSKGMEVFSDSTTSVAAFGIGGARVGAEGGDSFNVRNNELSLYAAGAGKNALKVSTSNVIRTGMRTILQKYERVEPSQTNSYTVSDLSSYANNTKFEVELQTSRVVIYSSTRGDIKRFSFEKSTSSTATSVTQSMQFYESLSSGVSPVNRNVTVKYTGSTNKIEIVAPAYADPIFVQDGLFFNTLDVETSTYVPSTEINGRCYLELDEYDDEDMDLFMMLSQDLQWDVFDTEPDED